MILEPCQPKFLMGPDNTLIASSLSVQIKCFGQLCALSATCFAMCLFTLLVKINNKKKY